MKTIPLNNTPTACVGAFKTTAKNDAVKRDIPTAEENPAAFALFEGIGQSEKFTIDVTYQAFAGVARQAKRE
jgi:hypothetical protein